MRLQVLMIKINMSLSSSEDKEQMNKSFCTHTMKVVGADNEGWQNADQVAQ